MSRLAANETGEAVVVHLGIGTARDLLTVEGTEGNETTVADVTLAEISVTTVARKVTGQTIAKKMLLLERMICEKDVASAVARKATRELTVPKTHEEDGQLLRLGLGLLPDQRKRVVEDTGPTAHRGLPTNTEDKCDQRINLLKGKVLNVAHLYPRAADRSLPFTARGLLLATTDDLALLKDRSSAHEKKSSVTKDK